MSKKKQKLKVGDIIQVSEKVKKAAGKLCRESENLFSLARKLGKDSEELRCEAWVLLNKEIPELLASEGVYRFRGSYNWATGEMEITDEIKPLSNWPLNLFLKREHDEMPTMKNEGNGGGVAR